MLRVPDPSILIDFALYFSSIEKLRTSPSIVISGLLRLPVISPAAFKVPDIARSGEIPEIKLKSSTSISYVKFAPNF